METNRSPATTTAPTTTPPITDEWVTRHFDHLSPELARDLHPTLARARSLCPVARSDAYENGFWVLTKYEDVLRVAQDWQTFSSELGITVPYRPPSTPMKILPVAVDPPLQRTFKRLVNAHFTPVKVTPWEAPTRALVNRLIDNFIERGECDFMTEFARPLPGLAFFEQALHAPADDLEQVNQWATMASLTHLEESRDGLMKLAGWIGQFIAKRRADERGGAQRRGDVVDAVLEAEIEGRPITLQEAIGTIHLLILGGLETTAGVLGAAMMRFCQHPEILEQIRARPELIPETVEELLRLDGSFICIGRTARHDTEIDGHQVKEGERGAGPPVLGIGQPRRGRVRRPRHLRPRPRTEPAHRDRRALPATARHQAQARGRHRLPLHLQPRPAHGPHHFHPRTAHRRLIQPG
jgi:cytochrome P450